MEYFKDYLQFRPEYRKDTSFEILGVKYEDVMKLPVHYLGVGDVAKRYLFDMDIRIDSTTRTRVKVIGQLMGLGFDKLEDHLMREAPKKYNSILYELELALARFSLRLGGSDFSVGSIKIQDLNLPEKIRNELYSYSFIDLGDLRKKGISFVTSNKYMSRAKKKEYIKAITAALMEFGVDPIIPKDLKPVKVENAAEGGAHAIPPMFPKIRESLKAEHLLVEEREAAEAKLAAESKASAILDNLAAKAKRSKFTVVDYTGKRYDYTKLLQLATARFPSRLQFKETVDVSNRTFKNIINGDHISKKSLDRIAEYFGCRPRDLVVVHTEIKDKNEENKKPSDVVPNVDYSKLKDMLERRMTNPYNLCKLLNIPYYAVSIAIRKGTHMNPEYLKSIANYLGCEPRDLMTENLSRSEVAERANKMRITHLPEYDYSRLINEVYSRYRVNLDEFGKMINLTKKQVYYLKRQLGVTQITKNKISRKLGIDFDKLAVPLRPAEQTEATAAGSAPKNASPAKEPEHKQPKTNTGFDYTPLFKKIDAKYTFYLDFLRDANISLGIFSRFYNGVKLREATLYKLMQFFNCSLDEIVRIENPEIKRQVEEKIQKIASGPKTMDADKVDYSKIIQLMEQRGITFEKLEADLHLSYTTIIKLKSNIRLSVYTIQAICKYLGCEPADVIDIEADVASHYSFEDKFYDYTGLLVLLQKKSISLNGLMRMIGCKTNYEPAFKRGAHVPREVLKKICDTLQCNLEDIVVFNEENFRRAKQLESQRKSAAAKKRYVAMHSSKILSIPELQGKPEPTAAPEQATPVGAEPEAPEAFAEDETMEADTAPQIPEDIMEDEAFDDDFAEDETMGAEVPTQPVDDDTFGGGNAGSGNPNAKFYMSQNGYINTTVGRVRKYVQKFQQDDFNIQREL